MPALRVPVPQSEEAQKLSTEVVGALWATVYDANAKAIQRFVKTVDALRWNNASIARRVRHYTQGLREMVALQVPHLCGDVHAWSATGFKAAPVSTAQFDRHVEAIEVKEPSQRFFASYEQASDKSVAERVAPGHSLRRTRILTRPKRLERPARSAGLEPVAPPASHASRLVLRPALVVAWSETRGWARSVWR